MAASSSDNTPNNVRSKQEKERYVAELRAALLTLGEQRHWKLLVCEPEQKGGKWKKPPFFLKGRFEHGVKNATRDLSILIEWLDACARESWPLLGVVTDSENGFWVSETDVGSGGKGAETLADLEARYGKLPTTLTSRSPSGGHHFFWKWEDGVVGAADRLGPNFDTRAGNEYVIVPPSVIPDYGRYEWVGHPSYAPSPAPDWLLSLARGGVLQPAKPTPSNMSLVEAMNRLQRNGRWNDEKLLLAAAHLVCKWPAKGHEPSIVLGSFLVSRAQWTDPDRIVQFVMMVGDAAGANDPEDRRRAALAGYERALKGGDRIAGLPKLRAIFGTETANEGGTPARLL